MIVSGQIKERVMSVEIRQEDGSLNAYCVKCGERLEATTQKLKELAASGEFETIDVLCSVCENKLSVGIQLGHKENGAL